MYIHEREKWTDFIYDKDGLSSLLEEANLKRGMLYGRLQALGFDSKLKAMATNLTFEVVSSSEIEGIYLNVDEVRASIARRLGIENVKYTSPSHYTNSVVAVMLDAIEHYNQDLTKEKLCLWQAGFFPFSSSEGINIGVGKYRSRQEHIISGMFGREKIHYIAPAAERVEEEMGKFISWFNNETLDDSIIRSAIAHLWFVSIHPFEDGNGRIARILSDIMLARGDKSQLRFYNVSSQINKDKNHYYDILERTQKGDGNINEWLLWYIKTLIKSLEKAEITINQILSKSLFWQRVSGISLTERQIKILNLFLDGYEAKITSKTWATLAKCSKDTAIRDIQYLRDKNILYSPNPEAKRPSFLIVFNQEDISIFFTNASILEEETGYYLNAKYKNKTLVHERLLNLDVERHLKGELSMSDLLNKYCSYLKVL